MRIHALSPPPFQQIGIRARLHRAKKNKLAIVCVRGKIYFTSRGLRISAPYSGIQGAMTCSGLGEPRVNSQKLALFCMHVGSIGICHVKHARGSSFA